MIKTDFEPYQDWLLVKLHDVEKETSSGFSISDKKLTPNKATVVKSGTDAISNKGETVYLEKQNLHEIKLDGEMYYAIRERFVIGMTKEK